MKYKFYDTCSLLQKVEHLFDDDSRMVISSVTLNELEHIKTAYNKDPDVKYSARKLTRLLDENIDKYDLCIYVNGYECDIDLRQLPHTNDTQILACAYNWMQDHLQDEFIFVSNDLCLKHLARMFFLPEQIESVQEADMSEYDGYLEIRMTDEDMAEFYSHPDENRYNLLLNQYLIICNTDGDPVDTAVWTEEGFRRIAFNNFTSRQFGNVKPMKGDVYQRLAADSLANNQITMIKGPAGSGKTFLSLSYLFHLLDRGEINKVIIFCNTVATKGSAKLGYYPGTRDEKLLDSQIGNLLSSKLGGRCEVERMIENEELVLLPLSDIRGYDTSGMCAGIYISEAQNMDISLMKLTLQRISEDSVCIIDGDCKAQVDDISFAGANNGMRRASQVFRGQDVYGEVTLHNIYRSKIAAIAENM